jgi:hypothetical protein
VYNGILFNSQYRSSENFREKIVAKVQVARMQGEKVRSELSLL